MKNRTELIRLLAELRVLYRATPPELRRGFKRACLPTFRMIEAVSPQDELWTSLPTEPELNEHSRLGDHLSVTRHLMGFVS